MSLRTRTITRISIIFEHNNKIIRCCRYSCNSYNSIGYYYRSVPKGQQHLYLRTLVTTTTTTTTTTPTTRWGTGTKDSIVSTVAEAPLHHEWVIPTTTTVTTDAVDNTTNNNNLIENNGSSNIVIVFLHGLLGNIRNIKTMATKICHVTKLPGLLIDLPGHGLSYEKQRLNNSSNSTNNNESKSTSSSTSSTISYMEQKLDDTIFNKTVDDIHKTIVFALNGINQSKMVESSLSSSSSSSSSSLEHKNKLILVGHSLGGRLSLQYTYNSDSFEPKVPVHQLWLLDTVPGTVDKQVRHILQSAMTVQESQQRTMSTTLQPGGDKYQQQQPKMMKKKKSEIVELLMKEPYQLDQGTSQWLASSYDTKRGEFTFDLQIAHSFVNGIHCQDLVAMVDDVLKRNSSTSTSTSSSSSSSPASSSSSSLTRIHLVQGGKNKAWQNPAIQLAMNTLLERYSTQFKVHTLPNASHWVHIDDLPGIVKAFEENP